jgi:hypothetical protein
MPQTYSCLIDDERYSVPTLILIDADDEGLARDRAVRELLASNFHRAVELHGRNGLVFRRERRTFT